MIDSKMNHEECVQTPTRRTRRFKQSETPHIWRFCRQRDRFRYRQETATRMALVLVSYRIGSVNLPVPVSTISLLFYR